MAGSPTLGDIYELTDKQTFRGQEVFNVYFYEVDETFVTTEATIAKVLGDNWIDQILPDIIGCHSAEVVHTQVSVRNLYDVADSYVTDISVAGLDTGSDVLPNFSAYPFQLAGETTAVKKGAKRIAGVPETAQTNGVVTDTSVLTALANAGDAMSRAVQVGLVIMSDVFFPVLVKRERDGVSGAYTYKLPHTRGAGVTTRIVSALFNVLVSSQVSRKIGVGI